MTRRTRDLFSKVHLWVGLIFGVWFALVCASGSLIVFEEELDRILNPAFFKTQAASAAVQPLPLAQVLEAARTARPDLVAESISLRHAPEGPYIVNLRTFGEAGRGADRYQVAVDPNHGSVNAIRSGFHPVHIIWQFHVDVLLGRPGQIVLGATAILLVLTTITGLVLWWPARGKFRQAVTIKPRARGHRLHVDLHRVTGFYLLVPFFVACFTGIVIIWPEKTFPAISWAIPIPHREAPPPPRPVAPDRWVDVDRAVAVGLERLGQTSLSYVNLPTPQAPFYRVTVRSYENGHPRGRGSALVYPDTGEIYASDTTYKAPLGYQIRWEWLVPTHSGDILGVPGKVAMLLAGFAPILFTITGTAIWLNKRRAHRQRIARALRPATGPTDVPASRQRPHPTPSRATKRPVSTKELV